MKCGAKRNFLYTVLCSFKLDKMERNYKAVKFLDKWYVQYEYYNRLKEKWLKKLFKDWNSDDLEFHTKEDADNWIEARIEIMKT